ncbi:MAG TPA: N-acetyltransferase [Parachlamydiales bacterium]|nr:N-acetyltransferase [Parachlamydiales bacterium]
MSTITTRFTEEGDYDLLVSWLMQPGVLRWFPLNDLKEIEDAARIWIGNAKNHSVLTALVDDVPCGVATLYLQPYKKLAHQCLFAIVVDEAFRGRGVGTKLLTDLIALGKERFQLEILHLEVYDGNPAVGLYQKLGFEKYGFQRHFIKDKGEYIGKILMQKRI